MNKIYENKKGKIIIPRLFQCRDGNINFDLLTLKDVLGNSLGHLCLSGKYVKVKFKSNRRRYT
ncbi:CLUMA_CG021204, isoform A [Clunio marinus]|uniref:CLUMA_CG021204, isoform A n=1 Tax=Clunio marinus TaxID=568069 RepID=A0A1J1J7Y5_9DIPT|nr:CLUMA_CG021204, isoform A [Clunio marinus]